MLAIPGYPTNIEQHRDFNRVLLAFLATLPR